MCVCLVTQLCPTLCNHMDCSCQATWNSPGKNIGVGSPFSSPGDLPDPGIKPRSLSLLVNSLPSESSGKTRIC